MKRIALVFLGTIFVGLAIWLIPGVMVEGLAQKDKIRHSESRIPGHYIVVLEDWVTGKRGRNSHANEVAQELGTAYRGSVNHVYRNAINGFSIEMSEEQAEALGEDPRVKYIEEDGVMYASTTQTNATWGLDRIDQRDLPLNQTYNYDATGTGVRAYIIDTGIRSTHSEFGGRVTGGYTAISDGRGTGDCNGHGTHVAGTVGGATYGVAKGVSLVPVRVLNCQGSGTTSGVIAGVDWVTSDHNAQQPAVANMSLGGSASSTLDTAVNNAISDGVTFVVAAGNSSANACNYSPSRVSAALTVGSTTTSDARSSFSNFGSCLDLFAPGSSITSAWSTSDTAINTISGTSMASPHVAGVVALFLQNNSNATPAQVASAITGNATPGKVTSAGSGSPNLLLYSIFGGGSQNQPPSASFTYSCSGLTCNFTDTSTDDGGSGNLTRSWDFGDGGTSTATNPSHTYATGGSFTVTLTATDAGDLSDSESKVVTVSASSVFTLSAVGFKQQGIKYADLAWSGATTTTVDIYRNNGFIVNTANDGTHTDNTGQRGAGSNTYRVCNAGTQTCSNTVTVTY